MDEIYFVQITGTIKSDQKWFFRNYRELVRFLNKLNTGRAEVEYFVKEDGSDLHKKVTEVWEGDKAESYWEKHMTVLQIDPARCPRHRELYKANFWLSIEFVRAKPLITNDKWIENLRELHASQAV